MAPPPSRSDLLEPWRSGRIALLCSEITVVNRDKYRGAASLLRCKCWDCEICQPFNRWHVVAAGRRGHPNVFMTLTCNPGRHETPDAAARDMVRALVQLRRCIFRRYKIKNIPILCVFEKTKAGWPHMHILARAGWIDQKWLSEVMGRLIGAPIVDIRKIQDAGRAAAYVSKYVGKDPTVFRGCKRWWRSHSYEVDKQDRHAKVQFGLGWQVMDTPFVNVAAEILSAGWYITTHNSHYLEFQREQPP